jgi:hypothetical protein
MKEHYLSVHEYHDDVKEMTTCALKERTLFIFLGKCIFCSAEKQIANCKEKYHHTSIEEDKCNF